MKEIHVLILGMLQIRVTNWVFFCDVDVCRSNTNDDRCWAVQTGTPSSCYESRWTDKLAVHCRCRSQLRTCTGRHQSHTIIQCESKKSPLRFLTIFPKRLGIFNQFFTHLLRVHFYTSLQIFIQLFPTLTKLCHIKRDHPANFSHFTRTSAYKFAYWANDVTVDVMSYPTCLMTL